MTKDILANMVNTRSSGDVRKLLEEAAALTDPQAITLLKELAAAHSPTWATDLSKDAVTRGEALRKLYYLEDHGFIKSDMLKAKNSLLRKFEVTDLGRKVVTALR